MTDEIKNIEMNTEITDAQAETASGGGWGQANPHYESGDTPLYKVGDKVGHHLYGLGWKDYTGRILAVSSTKSGVINKEFTYTVLWDKKKGPETDTNVYESELEKI